MESDYSTCLPSEASAKEGTPFEDEEEEEDERLDEPRLRKSLQSGILKLIHEIERLQANAAGEKRHPLHVLDSNTR